MYGSDQTDPRGDGDIGTLIAIGTYCAPFPGKKYCCEFYYSKS